jgi:hypothetical protein
MGAVEDAVDAAADFVGPFVDKQGRNRDNLEALEANTVVQQALSHLHAINSADLAADPDAPYDASLAGIVYGLLDVITILGVLPHLSPGLAFGQRPRSVLTAVCPLPCEQDAEQLSITVRELVPIFEQKGTGVQPLVSQRILPDIISALAELSFSPACRERHHEYVETYNQVIEKTPTSRLLPILTTFLQQVLPDWLNPVLSKALALIPLRDRGIRHTIEFLSLSYMSKNSQIPQDASGSVSQIAISMEAVRQASRLLVLPPTGIEQDVWLGQLAPQLWALLDGAEGTDLSRAAGQIIAGGILSKRATGAPGTAGWLLFAQPLIQDISPSGSMNRIVDGCVLVQEQDLQVAMKRLSVIALSHSHAGLSKRLLGPVILSVWAILNYAQERPALDKEWSLLAQSILTRYIALSCDAIQIDKIATHIFWDGDEMWAFKPGSQGGIEIRQRSSEDRGITEMNSVLVRVGSLDGRVSLLVSLLADAKAPDDVIGTIFLQVTKRWLSPLRGTKLAWANELDDDPFAVLIDAKLSEAIGNRFRDQLAQSPQHIIELMGQLIANYVSDHRVSVQKYAESNKPSRANLHHLLKTEAKANHGAGQLEDDYTEEELVSFAMSIINTLVSSASFTRTPRTQTTLAALIELLVYLSNEHIQIPISPLIANSADSLLRVLQPSSAIMQIYDNGPAADHRATLKTVLADLTSPEPPNRTWALNTLHKLVQDPPGFAIIDIPSITHLLLSASVADPESYVHISAIPVLVDLAVRTPTPVVRILVDAFIDIDEASLKLRRRKQTDEKDRELQEALDFRLRVGEILHAFVLKDDFFTSKIGRDTTIRYKYLKQISQACLALASRRGKRTQTLSSRTQLARAEREIQEEAEAAWGGPIPNLLDPEGNENAQDQADLDALRSIVSGWEDTGIEEDVRIRASALSVLGNILEHRVSFLRQVTVDSALQTAMSILAMETSEAKAILRRAAVMVVMGLLRGLDTLLEAGSEPSVGFNTTQQSEVTRALKWVGGEDVDALVRDHATSVLEGLETWRMKKLYQVRDWGLALGPDLNLEGNLRGLHVQPDVSKGIGGTRKIIVEEVE